MQNKTEKKSENLANLIVKLIKNEPYFKKLPVMIFSSLLSEETKQKGEALGVDAQLTKPEIGNLIRTLDGIINR